MDKLGQFADSCMLILAIFVGLLSAWKIITGFINDGVIFYPVIILIFVVLLNIQKIKK